MMYSAIVSALILHAIIPFCIATPVFSEDSSPEAPHIKPRSVQPQAAPLEASFRDFQFEGINLDFTIVFNFGPDSGKEMTLSYDPDHVAKEGTTLEVFGRSDEITTRFYQTSKKRDEAQYDVWILRRPYWRTNGP